MLRYLSNCEWATKGGLQNHMNDSKMILFFRKAQEI